MNLSKVLFSVLHIHRSLHLLQLDHVIQHEAAGGRDTVQIDHIEKLKTIHILHILDQN